MAAGKVLQQPPTWNSDDPMNSDASSREVAPLRKFGSKHIA